MKKLYLKLICTAALIAALPLTACTNADGNKQTTRDDTQIISPQSDDTSPDVDCDNGNCPDCPDGNCPEDGCDEHNKDECPKCPKKKLRGRTVFPRGNQGRKKTPLPPKKPIEPPKDDVILPDPPVEGELPQN